jgi:hypothetical protein
MRSMPHIIARPPVSAISSHSLYLSAADQLVVTIMRTQRDKSSSGNRVILRLDSTHRRTTHLLSRCGMTSRRVRHPQRRQRNSTSALKTTESHRGLSQVASQNSLRDHPRRRATADHIWPTVTTVKCYMDRQ